MTSRKVESWQESQQKNELLALSCSKPTYSFGKVNASLRIIALGLLLKEVRVVQTSILRVNNAGIAIRTHCCWRISHRSAAVSWFMEQ
jgi:cell division protein ZipA